MAPLASSYLQLLLCLVPGITGVWGYTFEGSCEQNCTGVPNGEKVPDPKYCDRYFECLDGEPQERQCEPSLYFNTASQVCDNSICPPNNPGCQPTCRFECQGNLPSAHRADCTKYYTCDPEGGMIEESCTEAGKPFWDGTQCQENAENCCDPCLAYCHENSALIPNPVNCQMYFECSADNYFPDTEDDARSCPSGQFFSVADGGCSYSDSSCVQICDQVGPSCGKDFTCPEEVYGAFPVCNNRCCKYYYYCDFFGLEISTCNSGLVFDPDHLVCLDEEDCPYPTYPCDPYSMK